MVRARDGAFERTGPRWSASEIAAALDSCHSGTCATRFGFSAMLWLALARDWVLSRKPSLPAKAPDDLIAVKRRADRLTDPLFKHRSPRHETEAEAIIEHCEASAGGRDHPPINT